MLMAAFGGGGGRGRHGRDYGPARSEDDSTPRLRLSDRRMLRWFAQQLRPQWWRVLLGTLATLVGAAAALVWPALLQPLIDRVIGQGEFSLLPRYLFALIAAYAAREFCMALRMNVMHILGQRFVYDLRVQCYQHLLRLSLSYFDDHPTGDVMSRLSNDVNAVEDMVVHGVDEVISNAVIIVGTVGFLLWKLEGRLLLLGAGLWPLPLFILGILIFSRYVRPIYRKIREDLGDINAEMQESISGVRVVKAFSREPYELERFQEHSWAYYRANARGIWMWSTFFPFVGFLISLGTVTVLWLGASPGADGRSVATAGEIMMIMAYLSQFYGPVGMLVRTYDIFNRALASLARIFQILDETPAIQDAPGAEELERVAGEVQLENVTFRYRDGEEVLKNLSVTARPGETVAIVGRSGAGKTSLVNLIPRFYDPTEGRVLVDGHDVRGVTQESLRRHIALVLQDTFLFDGTVRENIRYGRLEASDEEVESAARAAYADEFIVDLPEVYETRIGERGVKLSGGQRQRIAIARAVLADPRILILDEATSLVDTEAEQKIQAALDSLTQGRTVFVIAHRLSTVRNADKIIVLEGGEIAEEDHHEALLARGGLYAEMYSRQFSLDLWPGGDLSASSGPGAPGGPGNSP